MDNRFIIAIGSYNNEQWVSQNLESVLTQTYLKFKIVYYNACSTDNTLNIALSYQKNYPDRINVISTPERHLKTWFFENLEQMEPIQDSDIVCILDGDDFLANEGVLNYLNEAYNQTNCWMTYGGMVVWDGGERTVQPFPQNSVPPEEVFQHKLYRRDLWRYSHMRTCRGFLWKRLKKSDLKAAYDGNYMSMCDLCTVYPFLEMCPASKIFRVEESIYILNTSQGNGCRSYEELKANDLGKIYETEIRSRPPYPQLNVVSPVLAGGLGNQMFEVAAVASVAKDNNALLIVNPNEHILPNQGRNIKTYTTNVFSRIAFDGQPPVNSSYSWDSPFFKAIPYTPNTKMGGHFQSYKYFDHNRKYIQDLFAPTAEIVEHIEKTYPANFAKITAIQVRRGDYHKFPDHHPLLPPEYYVKAVKMAASEEVWVFSDDLEWCKQNLHFDCPVRYIKDEDYIELYIMALCKNVVMSNSSFGWWAAYLNTRPDKQIFAPSTWYGPKILEQGFQIDDLLMPDWVRI